MMTFLLLLLVEEMFVIAEIVVSVHLNVASQAMTTPEIISALQAAVQVAV